MGRCQRSGADLREARRGRKREKGGGVSSLSDEGMRENVPKTKGRKTNSISKGKVFANKRSLQYVMLRLESIRCKLS